MRPKKGALQVGSDADIVVRDPAAEHTITARTHHMRVDYSIFEGFEVRGNPSQVVSRGEVIVDSATFPAHAGRGRYLRRARLTSCPAEVFRGRLCLFPLPAWPAACLSPECAAA
ncbi:MAG: hypothetical protein ABSB15_21865 [Bryobacteraceae bacterium]